ncbi:hypothetical protein [Aliikangiella sp. IMCC44359]|uniref:hypothetical protein n=1 Tax=Aliikangiella sp. IMCC44359 TaxID=3459125 RepID=UPI00403ABDF3
MLIKSPFAEVKNPQKAIRLADELSEYSFWDNATEYEIKAAAYAALENYDEAINMQKKALSKAKRMRVDVTEIKEHLSLLKQNKKWF